MKMLAAFLLVILVVALGARMPGIAEAQSPAPANTNDQAPVDPNPGLKLAPVKYEETVEPGQAKDGTVTVLNTSNQALTVTPTVENIRMTGDNGTLDFYVGDNPFRLHTFVQLDKTPFTLNAGEGRNVKFRVTIPAGTFPGGYFGSVLFQITPPETSASGLAVSQAGRVGSLLILTVAGESDRRGSIKQAILTQNDFSERKTFLVKYANEGNTDQPPLGVAYKPQGRLVVRNTFGVKVADQPLTGETTFPGAERRFEIKNSKPLWFGRYRADVRLAPGEGQAAETKSVHFWAISPLALGLFILIAGLLAALSLEIFRRRKQLHLVKPSSTLAKRHQGDTSERPTPDRTSDNVEEKTDTSA